MSASGFIPSVVCHILNRNKCYKFHLDILCCHDTSYSTIALLYSMHKPEVANIASKMAPIRRISPENGLKGQILQGNVFNELH